VLAGARRAAEGGRYQEADRILGEFAVQHPQSTEGSEADFWRALFRADPANTESTVREQLAAFDSYLSGGKSMPRYAEAQVLRRMVEVIDSTRALIVAVRAAADARERAKTDEVKRISDELEKAVTELERIKRRLTPKPPH
jgi:acyl-CoA reductase-like NAD-dependent aldehyde dehydrogenase